MSTKPQFAPIPASLAKMVAETPEGIAASQSPAPTPVVPAQEAKPLFREKEAFQKMSINMPKALYEDLRAYMKMTDIPMSDVIVEGAHQQLARLKKQGMA